MQQLARECIKGFREASWDSRGESTLHHRQIARERERGGRQEQRGREGKREGGRNRKFMYINLFKKSIVAPGS